MTPAEIALAKSIVGLLGQMGGLWPLITVFLILFLGPVLVAININRGQRDIIQANTEAINRLTENITGNQFCPLVRVERQLHLQLAGKQQPA